MEIFVKATLIDESGWQKNYDLAEGVFWLGSAPKAQLRLPQASGVAPYALQIVNSLSETSLRLINLSSDDIQYVNGEGTKYFSSGNVLDIFGGEQFKIGMYQLEFTIDKPYFHKEVTREEKQTLMGARLILSDLVLRPEEILIGKLSLQNLGNEACQFDVTIDGIPEGCYEISPPPLIYGGGEESMEIRFFHRKTAPPAGSLEMNLRVSANDVYPGEEITIQQMIKVVPHYEHTLTFVVPELVEEPVPLPLDEVEPIESVISPLTMVDVEPSQEALTTPVELKTKPEMYALDERKANSLAAEKPVFEETATTQITDASLTAQTQSGTVFSQEGEEIEQTQSGKPITPTTEQSENEPTAETMETRQRKSKRPDLSAIKVMKASSGDFLEKRTDKE